MAVPLFRKVDCFSIPVPDLDAALAFYRNALGHELIWRSSKAAGLRLPDATAELVLHTDNRPVETDLAVDSVPDALRRFTSAGGRLLQGPFEIQIGLCAVVADPWANTLVILDASMGALRVDERIVPHDVTGQHAEVVRFHMLGSLGRSHDEGEPVRQLLRDVPRQLAHRSVALEQAPGQATDDDQEIQIAVHPRFAARPGSEEHDADKVGAEPRPQRAGVSI
jgi:predicted enzyme related to lactoylglutathione lyase